MVAKTNSFLERAYERLTNISASEEKRLEYVAREKALRDYNHQMRSNWKAGHAQGLEQGIVETLQEQGASYDDAIAKVAQKLSLTREEATQCVRKYWKD